MSPHLAEIISIDSLKDALPILEANVSVEDLIPVIDQSRFSALRRALRWLISGIMSPHPAGMISIDLLRDTLAKLEANVSVEDILSVIEQEPKHIRPSCAAAPETAIVQSNDHIKSPIPRITMEERLWLRRVTEEAFPNGEEPLTVSFFDVSDCGPTPDVTPGKQLGAWTGRGLW